VDVTSDLSSATAVTISAANLNDSAAGVGALTGLSTLSGLAISTVNNAIQNVANLRAVNGAEQSRLGFASTLLTNNQTNLQSAISNISDVDVAQETSQLAKWQVLVQSGTAMLTQANQSAQSTLRLITG
jgi:flagellin